jgi:hypothetical protein
MSNRHFGFWVFDFRNLWSLDRLDPNLISVLEVWQSAGAPGGLPVGYNHVSDLAELACIMHIRTRIR